MRAPWAIVCDFDGTALTEDVGDAVSQHFAGFAVWRRAEDEYRAGAFDFGELLRRIFEPITASEEEIAAFARERAVLRPGFEEFVQACASAGRPFVVCSAGLDVYIEPVLERLPAHLRRHIQLRSNRARCSPAGMALEFHRPGRADGCGRCGFCKGSVVRELRDQGHRVLVCGDGTADRCAADAADFVFATRRLVHYCCERGLAHQAFDDFHQVIARFPEAPPQLS
ncbi:MAG TPA: MtnX-like HAD-IB family phosphatase [Anaeromyxobacteraceae bacterium]|nr:MtnX-like HAD-IB family phosphatase [Anaeromyxobacteraceae bacterium]